MKKILAYILISMIASVAMAAGYKVEEIPNVHLTNRDRFVSNPDGVLSSAAVDRIDRSLRTLRDSTSVEAVVVVVNSIDDTSDIDRFATELFDKWGLGKKDLDNGLLLLVAKEQRKATIRTGYGLEGVLPDVACGRLLRNVMFPAFRSGDFDKGVESSMEMISAIISDPANATEVISKLEDSDYTPSTQEEIEFSAADIGGIMAGLGVTATGVLLLLLILFRRNAKREEPTEQWRKLTALRTFAAIALFLGLGIPLIALIPIMLTMRRMRKKHGKCPNCGHKMRKLDEKSDNMYLTHAQDMEEKLNSIDYDVWLCDECGTTDVIPYVNPASSYTTCSVCGACACTLTRDMTIVSPTQRQAGVGERSYKCLNCHNITKKRYEIAKLASAAPIIIGGIGGSGGGGGSFGGGFGGGMTGGGGASGSW